MSHQLRLAFVATTLALPATAHADQRSFTYTYEYATAPKGTTDVEVMSTQSRPELGHGKPEGWELRLEFEHGITDHWDVALYHVFEQVTSADEAEAEPLTLHKMSLESRYRFGERGQYPVNALAYVELAKDVGGSVYEVEAKAVLDRDFDKLRIAVNLIGEVELGRDVPSAYLTVGWAAGATYQISPKLHLGAESYGGHNVEDSGEVQASIGPALGWAPSSTFWVSATSGFGVSGPAADVDARVILGLHL